MVFSLDPWNPLILEPKAEGSLLYSSLPEYLTVSKTNSRCQKEAVLGYFKNPQQYQKFVFDQADYQKKLANIKHLILEK